ncbi:MAG: hypothetical protein Q9218_003218 [Villophora microphyllina]
MDSIRAAIEDFSNRLHKDRSNTRWLTVDDAGAPPLRLSDLALEEPATKANMFWSEADHTWTFERGGERRRLVPVTDLFPTMASALRRSGRAHGQAAALTTIQQGGWHIPRADVRMFVDIWKDHKLGDLDAHDDQLWSFAYRHSRQVVLDSYGSELEAWFKRRGRPLEPNGSAGTPIRPMTGVVRLHNEI